MKKLVVFSLMFLGLSVLSCQDSTDAPSAAESLIAEYKNVGMKIPTEQGARWISTYNDINPNNRVRLLYSVSSASLQTAMNSVDELVGLAFQYGFDENGIKHIIIIPVDRSLRLWTNIEGRVYVDANTNSEISQAVAQEWANSYQASNPDGIWFHYFGRTIFDEIASRPGSSRVNIIPALRDTDYAPQMLLVVGNVLDLLNGRVRTETDVYDASYPCPKCPVN